MTLLPLEFQARRAEGGKERSPLGALISNGCSLRHDIDTCVCLRVEMGILFIIN